MVQTAERILWDAPHRCTEIHRGGIMKNLEFIQTCSKEELVRFFCDLSDCSDCVARDHCRTGHNGFIDWLEREKDE